MPAGTGYTVTASKQGYTSASVTGVEVTADETTSGVDITLTSDEDGCLVTYKEVFVMKKAYEKPEIEITTFEPEDILASSLTNGGSGTGDEFGWGDIH